MPRRKQKTLEVSYGCGCCGRTSTRSAFVNNDGFCRDCAGHVAQDNRPPWDRVYQAITGQPCPFDLVEQVAHENEAARATAAGTSSTLPKKKELPDCHYSAIAHFLATEQ